MIGNEATVPANQFARGRNGVRIKTIALPVEHGGWGFLFEPIVLGLLLAPSVAGLYLALSAVGFFLARHPLTLVMLNRRRASPRNALARRFAALYIIIGISSFIAAISFAEHSFLLPLVIAAPLALVQLTHDWTDRRRVLLSELAGAIAISSLAAAIALSGGWSKPVSFALWAIMIARTVPAILYVRACLARLHQRPKTALPTGRRAAKPIPMLSAHVLAVISIAFLVRTALAPRLAVVAMLILFLRASVTFTLAGRHRVTAKQLGFSEIAFGTVAVFAVVVGHLLGL
jgi:hypothetical protein